MKTKKISGKLIINKKTVANLGEQLNNIKGGAVRTFTQAAFFTCDLPNCLTQQYETCGVVCPDPPWSGQVFCQLCDKTDPVSCVVKG
ncbi:MAG: hypothetical protein GY765_13940 [bacterium]|nr:hypothetical protein [bacterium]